MVSRDIQLNARVHFVLDEIAQLIIVIKINFQVIMCALMINLPFPLQKVLILVL